MGSAGLLGQCSQGQLDAFTDPDLLGQGFECRSRLTVVVSQCKQGLQNVRLHVTGYRCNHPNIGAKLALEFQQQPLSGFFTYAWDLDQAPCFLHSDGLRQFCHTHA